MSAYHIFNLLRCYIYSIAIDETAMKIIIIRILNYVGTYIFYGVIWGLLNFVNDNKVVG